MSQAKRDENRATTLIAALNTDGVTPNLVYIDPSTHCLSVDDDVSGSDFGVVNSVRDENRVAVATAVSSSDGITPVELYSDSLFKLLIQST